MKTIQTILQSWKHHLQRSRFRNQAVFSIALLLTTLTLFTRFLGWVEARTGMVLADPVLALIVPKDFTWLTFGLIYLAVLTTIIHLADKPAAFLLAIHSYTMMVIVRMMMMFLTPLEAPEGLIVLRDPLVQFLGDGTAPTKDLFFSGHTSTLVLLALVAQTARLKALFATFAVIVAGCLVWQHVHYVVDVAVAPFVAYTCYRLALLWQARTL
jgi:hypothetical protein